VAVYLGVFVIWLLVVLRCWREGKGAAGNHATHK
jgi:hypothetical protein